MHGINRSFARKRDRRKMLATPSIGVTFRPSLGAPGSFVSLAVARNSYCRLIAFLAARSGDVVGAEDTFVAALERWPVDGIPQKPEAWLLHVARSRIIDAARHNQVRQNSEKSSEQIAEEAQIVAATTPDKKPKCRIRYQSLSGVR